jgi:Helicase conserved C-terminal domain
MNSDQIRKELVAALRLDLIGPGPDDAEHAQEVLPHAPSKWYLTGFLVPYEADIAQKTDETADEEIEGPAGAEGEGDDEIVPDAPSARRAFFPSSMGISVLVPESTRELQVIVDWGDYKPNTADNKPSEDGAPAWPTTWTRSPKHAEITVSLGAKAQPASHKLLADDLLSIVVSERPIGNYGGLPADTRSVSIFLVNQRAALPREIMDAAFVFQARLTVKAETSFVARPDLHGLDGEDWDDRVADLQYADVTEHAVGHNVSVRVEREDDRCCTVATEWIPNAEVEKVEPTVVPGVNLEMAVLADAATADDVRTLLGALTVEYAKWIADHRAKLPADPKRKECADVLLSDADLARKRIEAGLAALDDPLALEAFRLMNRTMHASMAQRKKVTGKGPDKPSWYVFQLAFILLNLPAMTDPLHKDRNVVDLLFFPTGGGKTEAYLGLAAFTLVLRRLRNPGIASAGMSVLMRYTLRLLTLDQLSRAAALICALELERQKDPAKLGEWPFEIGLWVGMSATPNKMGKVGDGDDNCARMRTIRYRKDAKGKPAPVPLENCPWCGKRLTKNSFQLFPDDQNPLDLRLTCTCEFNGDNPLPILAVDQPIYRRLPCFLISTVDKFASLPWVGRTGALFGRVERYNKDGFYGPCDPGVGVRLNEPLLPPDLIIQDELHLISGPLGTMAGLYETVVDALASRMIDDKESRPKIIASTATVRRAERQVQALFARHQVSIFPPPSPVRRKVFFAETIPSTAKNARLYVGVAAQGRSLKVVLLRSYLTLLSAAQKIWQAEGGKRNKNNPADPYMTLVGYFNSLRELGGSRRIVEDEVTSRLTNFGERRRLGETTGMFADRKKLGEPVELTSRVPTNKVAEAKRRLATTFDGKDPVDVALATNMISVGLDITRLGLMVVLGQPKTAAEYIQTTSRVGRDDERPGLVVCLLNVHRPRDRSHYERFVSWHSSFYRAVEATSVTPFAPRAVDRAVAGVSVALARHLVSTLTAPKAASAMDVQRAIAEIAADTLAKRAEDHDTRLTPTEVTELRTKIFTRVQDLLDDWSDIAKGFNDTGEHKLQYGREEASAHPLLLNPLNPDLKNRSQKERKFVAPWSLRDVEHSVGLWLWSDEKKGGA